jgi:hypothetical protein
MAKEREKEAERGKRKKKNKVGNTEILCLDKEEIR